MCTVNSWRVRPVNKFNFIPLRPPLDLPGPKTICFSFFTFPGPVRRSPIEFAERFFRFLIIHRLAQRCHPARHHGPVIVIPGLGLPPVAAPRTSRACLSNAGTVSSADFQYVRRTSTSTPSTSKIKIAGEIFLFLPRLALSTSPRQKVRSQKFAVQPAIVKRAGMS